MYRYTNQSYFYTAFVIKHDYKQSNTYSNQTQTTIINNQTQTWL